MPLPASNWSELLDFPGQIASAWGSILAAKKSTLIGTDTFADASAFLFSPRENAAEAKDCISYTAGGFAQASDQQVRATSTTGRPFFFAHYSGQLITSVKTPRGATGNTALNSAAAMHGPRVALLLAYLQAPAQLFTSTNLPYYEVIMITSQAVPSAEQDQTLDLDHTDIIAHVEIWIRPDAFPAALP